MSPYVSNVTAGDLPKKGDCLIAILTFRGSIPKSVYEHMRANLPQNPVDIRRMGEDPYANIKKRFDPDIPNYYVSILDFGKLEQGVTLPDWLPPKG